MEHRPEFLVLRVDRTDPSKNVVRGLRAYELFLEAHPELHGRVQMLAFLDPSRQDIPEYAEYLAAIQRAARTVNDRFQTVDWTPLDLQIADNFAQSVAAYKQYDVLLVNAIFDGMNLVAKEAPLVNERDGVLILSENTGAHEQLGEWALTVNPFDVSAQADAIHEALFMPADDGAPPAGDPRAGARARRHALDRRAAAGPRRGVGAGARGDSMSELSHVDESGRVRMVDVGVEAGLPPPRGRAGIRAHGGRDPSACASLPKGDALVTAELAGVMAAKRTSDLIPLCHPLPLTSIQVSAGVGTAAWRSRPPPRRRGTPASRWRRSSRPRSPP